MFHKKFFIFLLYSLAFIFFSTLIAANNEETNQKQPSTRIECPDKVSSSKATIKVFIDKELLEKTKKDNQILLLGVQPESQSDTIWIQYGSIKMSETKRTINVGPDREHVEEGYTIILFSIEKESIKEEGAIKLDTLDNAPKFKDLARKEIHRIK